MIHVYSKKFLKGVLKIKRLFSFTLIFIICVACVIPIGASAVSFGGGTMRPYLDYVFSADGFSCSAPTISSVIDDDWVIGTQVKMDFFGNDEDLKDADIIARNMVLSEFDEFNEAEFELEYLFSNATVGDVDFMPTHFDFQFAPFTCFFRDIFQYHKTTATNVELDALTLYDTIGLICSWRGAQDAYVSGDFEFRINYVKKQSYDTIHNLYTYDPLTHRYSVSFQNIMSDTFYFMNIDTENIIIRDLTDNIDIGITELYFQVLADTQLMRQYYDDTDIGEVYVDIEYLNLNIDIVNAPFTGLVQHNAPYIDVDGYDIINGLFWNPNEGNYAFRQQSRGSYIAVMASSNLNEQQIHDVDFNGDYNNPIVRVPALFLSAVGEFFAIDFFGLGITLGHLTFVVFLASAVLIYLKFFAGG